MTTNFDFSGKWQSSYTFDTSSPDSDFTDNYEVDIRGAGNQIIIQSLPKDDGSYILLRLTQDGHILTGIWYEHTAAKGHYEGVTYYGGVQLLVDQDGNAMHGRWLGLDDQMTFQSGEQHIVRVSNS